jgi:hypothetical protein
MGQPTEGRNEEIEANEKKWCVAAAPLFLAVFHKSSYMGMGVTVFLNFYSCAKAPGKDTS